MRNRSDSASQAIRSNSISQLKRGMAIWVWSRRPAKIIDSYGDGTYEIEYVGNDSSATRINRNDIDPMDAEQRDEFLSKPRLEPDYHAEPDHKRSPLRKFMDEWPVSRAQLVKLLGFSPPKVDRLIADSFLPLDVAVLVGIIFDVDVDPNVVHIDQRGHFEDAMAAAREGARETSQASEG